MDAETLDLLIAQGKLPGAFRHEECQIFLGRRGHGELPAWVHFHHPHAANEVVQEDSGVLGEHRSAGRPRSISAGASPRDFIRVDAPTIEQIFTEVSLTRAEVERIIAAV